MMCGYGVRVLWNPFFRFVTHISISLMISMLTHILFSLRILLLAVEMTDRQAIRSQPDKLLPRTLYRIRVTEHVILKVREEDAMNIMHYLHHYQIKERAGISNKS